MSQKVFFQNNIQISKWLTGKKALLVCGQSFELLDIAQYFMYSNIEKFSDFTPNPTYESVKKGIKVFKENGCNAIVAVGGGSAIDVAKCIKLYANLDDNISYLEQEIIANNIPFMVVPTTAGSGSEATSFAVIYYNKEKITVEHRSCTPDIVVFDLSVLDKLPLYQKKSTLLDAFCHAVESYWSIKATDESKRYSSIAINLLLANMDRYLLGDRGVAKEMFIAANMAGRAINIANTTAGHAMCYKLTGMYGIAHGHAAALCVAKLWLYMLAHTEKCIDPRGQKYVRRVFDELAQCMMVASPKNAVDKFEKILEKMDFESFKALKGDVDELTLTVNAKRLKNNPIKLDRQSIYELYKKIIEGN